MSESPSVSRLSLAFRQYPKRSLVYQIATRGAHLLRSLSCTRHVAPVALLIDGDNIACDMVGPILIEAGKYGGVVIRRVYGNWAQPSMQRWKEVCQHYSLQQMHHMEVNAFQKNATDIALVVDAMDLLHKEHIDHFCIVTSDSDYTPLAERLREAGCFVLGIGRATTSPSFSRACTTFLTTDQLIPPTYQPRPVTTAPTQIDVVQTTQAIQTPQVLQVIQSAQSAQAMETDGLEKAALSTVELLQHQEQEKLAPLPFPAVPVAPTKSDKELVNLLMESYRSAKRADTDWVLVSKLGLEIHKRKPDFNSNYYGQKDLSSLIRLYDSIFELRKRSTGHPEIRMIQ